MSKRKSTKKEKNMEGESMELLDKIKTETKRYLKPLVDFANSSMKNKLVGLSTLWFFCLMPIWVSLLILWIAGPATFWQGFAIASVLAVILGIPQFILVILAGSATFMIIDESINDFEDPFEDPKKYTYQEEKPSE
jgi:hypothetical protein